MIMGPNRSFQCLNGSNHDEKIPAVSGSFDQLGTELFHVGLSELAGREYV